MKNTPIRKSLWETQLAYPNYLNAQLPREIHGWHNFTASQQEAFKTAERARLADMGFKEQENGSFIKS